MNIPYRQTPNTSSRKRAKIQFIILHSTGYSGTTQYEGSVSWLCNPKSKVSAHYVIARDGRITQLAQCADATWHAGVSEWQGRKNINSCSIGIEMEHSDKNHDDWPDTQMYALASMVHLLMEKFNIPVANVIGHKDIAPGRKVDPADFDYTRLRKLLSQF